uniref:Uncharacterized protein n=1 Tax=Oryza nivara TaxID=4536 RepID=A0A0E0IVM2_ORYNI
MAAAAGWSGGVRAEGRRTEREGKGLPVRRPWKVFPKIAEQINKMAVTNSNKIATKSTPPLHGPEDAAGGWGGGRNGAAPSSVRRVGQRQRRRGDVDAASSLRRHRRLEVDEQVSPERGPSPHLLILFLPPQREEGGAPRLTAVLFSRTPREKEREEGGGLPLASGTSAAEV